MKLISHRGNLYGPEPEYENKKEYIQEAIDEGFEVEVDVWVDPYTQKAYLGHDSAEEEVELKWIVEKRNDLWIHCKNLYALYAFAVYRDGKMFNVFYHQIDDFTLTSKNFIWTFPNNKVTDKSVIVCQSLTETNKYFKQNKAFGICSDFVGLMI